MRRRENQYNIAYLNFAFVWGKSLLAILIVMFCFITVKNISPVKPDAKVEIILTWDNYSSDDVDLYVETPDQKVVYFANRESDGGLVSLDRDDLGINDQTIVNNQVINDPNRDETTSIRGNLEGHYVVTANLYNYRDASNFTTGDKLPKPIHVKIQIIQLDPPNGIVYSGNENITLDGQELYLVDFDIKEGYVINIENNHPTSVMELIAHSSSFIPADATQ